MANSTKASPKKPRPEAPPFAHASGRWCKKVKGRFHYFGSVADDPTGETARRLWAEQRDDLKAGRIPHKAVEGISIRDLFNRFLTAKQIQVKARKRSQRTWLDYHRVCERMIQVFGRDRAAADLGPHDFERLYAELSKTNRTVAMAGFIIRVRSIFKYAERSELIPKRERYGEGFDVPDALELRRERRRRPPKMFEAAECRRMLEAAPLTLRGMILLGLNAAYGNADCGHLTLADIDLEKGLATLTRSKTEIDRIAPLWPQTIEALKAAIAVRPRPAEPQFAKHVFLTPTGHPLTSSPTTNPVSRAMGDLLRKLKIQRAGVCFYSLRHVAASIGLETGDRDAVKALMGHSHGDMLSKYDEQGPSLARLTAVTDHIRSWLWPEGYSESSSQPEATESP